MDGAVMKIEVDRWDEDVSAWRVAELGDYYVDIIPMIFNHRVVLTNKAHQEGYVVGWCYPDLLGALVAVMGWHPEQGVLEPSGYLKRVGELADYFGG
jgi:hypothetical protein